jgi:SAM-dependent methyltransferase
MLPQFVESRLNQPKIAKNEAGANAMHRTVEPELMNELEQAVAYAQADFDAAHNEIITNFDQCFPNSNLKGPVLDLGCGPGDISFRFAARFPGCSVTGVDGAPRMIQLANERRAKEQSLCSRVSFVEGLLPGASIPPGPWEAIISNSLLHHLHHPEVLWETIVAQASPGTRVFVADLRRPANEKEARRMVEKYCPDEPDILKRDFYNSLLAAFEPVEIRQQLADAGLVELEIKILTDRHMLVFGGIR